MSKKTKNKRQYDRAKSIEQIKQAAIELFSEKGYNSTTTRDIAERSQLNICLISRYFSGKEGLLKEIIEDFIEYRKTAKLPYPPQNTITEEVKCYLVSMFEETQQNIQFTKILFSQVMNSPKTLQGGKKLMDHQEDERLYCRLLELVKKEQIPTESAEEISLLVTTYFTGLVLCKLILFPQLNIDFHEDIEIFLKHFTYNN